MKEFKKIIKEKGLRKTIFYVVLILIVLSPLIILKKQIKADLKGTCIITDLKSLQECAYQKRHVTIKTDNVYDVGYDYKVGNKVKGKFLDIDVEGNAIIALVDTDTADKLLSKEGKREISGHFTKFGNKVFASTLSKIENDYIERFSKEGDVITKEQTKGMFYKYMLNQYNGRKLSFVYLLIIVVIFAIILFFKLLDGLRMLIKPEKYIVYGRRKLENDDHAKQASFELVNGPHIFKNKNIIISNNYIFDKTGMDFSYHKINEVTFIGNEIEKKYGLFEEKYLIIKFRDKSIFSLKLNDAEEKKIMEIVRVKNPEVLKGKKITKKKINILNKEKTKRKK